MPRWKTLSSVSFLAVQLFSDSFNYYKTRFSFSMYTSLLPNGKMQWLATLISIIQGFRHESDC